MKNLKISIPCGARSAELGLFSSRSHSLLVTLANQGLEAPSGKFRSFPQSTPLSEYIRVRLLEEESANKFSKHKRDMTILNVFDHHLLGKLARKEFSEEEINEVKARAKKSLAKYDIQYG
jgi:hypothetical protein